MFTSKRDIVVPLDLPRSDAGAPLPIVIADDRQVYLAYIVAQVDPSEPGGQPTEIQLDSGQKIIAIVTFERPHAHTFGAPNDEAFAGHPLAKRGLEPYAIAEVQASSWIHQLERMNSVHPYHNKRFFESYRHFVFAFHDSVFECVAQGLSVMTMRGAMRSALGRLAELLAAGADG